MLKIGSITLEKPFFQASLSGYSDYAMRKLAFDFGSPLNFAGVMLAKTAVHPKILRKDIFRPYEDEHPVGAQILGTDPEVMAHAAKELVEVGYDIIDLNFACPAPKVLRRGRGGALLKEPEKVIQIYRKVREAVSCPVTMKLRIGFDRSGKSEDNFMQICTRAAQEGIDALIIHGRTVKQYYRDKADWQLLGSLKGQFPNTTIIGSGDLFEPADIVGKLRQSKLDGVIIARGAIGNPWIFRDLDTLLSGGILPSRPDMSEQLEIILMHFDLICQVHPERKVIGYFRKFLARYATLHPEHKKVKKALLAAKDKIELLGILNYWYKD